MRDQRNHVIKRDSTKFRIKIKDNFFELLMVDSLSALTRVMDFASAMETFAEAWVAANVTQVNIVK